MPSKGSTGKPHARKLPRAERERQMLQVAARVFGQRGYHAAAMDEIACACGVTKPMLYAYFGSKEGLYLATVDRMGTHLVSSVERLLEEGDPVRRLGLGVDLILRFIQNDRHAWAVLYAEGLGEGPVARHVAAYRERIVQAAAMTLADAVPGRGLAQAVPYAVGLLGAGEALARWWLDRQRLPFAAVQAITHQMVEAALAAFRSGGTPPADPKKKALPPDQGQGLVPNPRVTGRRPREPSSRRAG